MARFIIILTTIYGACAYNFESYFEATIIDKALGIESCLGECFKGQCVYDWYGDETSCSKSNNPTKRYTTIDNEKCKSNCIPYKGEYDWCVTARPGEHWGKCSRKIALKSKLRHTTENKFLTCQDDCGEHGKSYNWCYTIKSWEYCYVDDKALVPNYPTKYETTCETPCKLYYSDSEAYCYDTKGNWAPCFLNPRYEHMLNNVARHLKRTCRFGVYSSNGYNKSCNKNKHKRSGDDLHFHECDLDIEAIAEERRANAPSDEVRTIDPNNPITRDPNPILSYTTLPRRGRFDPTTGVQTEDVDLPLVLQAQLTTYTLLPVGEQRESFLGYVTNNYNGMNPNRGDFAGNNDERGHILASRLGGPTEMFNIFPQPWRLNRGSGSSWFHMEQHIDYFLRGYNNRHVEFLAILGYLTDQHGVLNPRPDHIGIRLRFHVNNILTDRHGNRLSSFEDNETENMFFSNDPDDDCIIAVANELD